MPKQKPVFPQDGQNTACFPSDGLGISGTSDVTRIRPAVLSGCAVRLCPAVIHNGENPQDRAWSVGGSRTGLGPVWRHTFKGGDRGLKATRQRGTSRAATPFHHRDHAIGCVSGHADASLHVQGVGMT